MRVLFFLPDISRTGGVERVVSNLANLFITWKGYDVTILSCFNINKFIAYKLHNEVKTDCLNVGMYPNNPIKKIQWYFQLIKPLEIYLDKNQYDVILAEGSYLCATLSLVKHPKTIRIGCEHIAHYAVNIGQKILRKMLYRRLDQLVVLTKNDKGYFNTFLTRVVQIPNFTGQQTQFIGNEVREKVIISAGRLTHQKGFDLLLEAYALVMQQHPDWKLKIWGEGEERVRLKKISGKLNIEHSVSLPGETRELQKEFTKSMIFVMPSRYEGFPMTLLEAMQAGLPCVSFNCSGPDEIIDHELNGILVAQGDVQGLADAMIRMIEDAVKRESIAAAGCIKVEQYSVEKIGLMWKELFDSLVTPIPFSSRKVVEGHKTV